MTSSSVAGRLASRSDDGEVAPARGVQHSGAVVGVGQPEGREHDRSLALLVDPPGAPVLAQDLDVPVLAQDLADVVAGQLPVVRPLDEAGASRRRRGGPPAAVP